MLLKFTGLNFPPVVAVSSHYQKIEKNKNKKTKKYKIKIKCKIRGGVIIEVTDKVIRIIRNVIRIIEIDKYYTDSGNNNSSHIIKNDFNTCKQK